MHQSVKKKRLTPPLKWHGGKHYLAERIIDLMHEMQERENTTFVVATHDPMVAERACRRLQIHDGRIAGDVDLRNGSETDA